MDTCIREEEIFGHELEELEVIEHISKKVGFSEKITDLLGDCYKQWKIGECIFMSASTGLGKTYMIQECLYEYAQETKSEIALLVNRKALLEQIRERFKIHEMEKGRSKVGIHLFTYQQIEQDGDGAKEAKKILKKCRYIVCHQFTSFGHF